MTIKEDFEKLWEIESQHEDYIYDRDENLNFDKDHLVKSMANIFYKAVATGISKLREEGKIVDWKHDVGNKLKRTGIWRLNQH